MRFGVSSSSVPATILRRQKGCWARRMGNTQSDCCPAEIFDLDSFHASILQLWVWVASLWSDDEPFRHNSHLSFSLQREWLHVKYVYCKTVRHNHVILKARLAMGRNNPLNYHCRVSQHFAWRSNTLLQPGRRERYRILQTIVPLFHPLPSLYHHRLRAQMSNIISNRPSEPIPHRLYPNSDRETPLRQNLVSKAQDNQ